MSIPKRVKSSADGYPQSIEWALRAAHAKHGSSIVSPTAFNVIKDAATRAMDRAAGAHIDDVPDMVIEQIERHRRSPRYLAPSESYVQAIEIIKEH